MIDVQEVRKEFPFLNKGYIYFDSAATCLKPETVISREAEYYRNLSVNINRGTSNFNYRASEGVNEVRTSVAEYIGTSDPREIIFTSNTTESINTVALGYVKENIKENSNIVITQLEHHSNYAPWINLAKEMKVECRIAPLINGSINTQDIVKLIDDNTVITAITGMSNLTGQQLDIKTVSKRCRSYNSKLLIDAAQLIVHKKIDVKNIDVDFLCFSGHKIYGTFGLGVLYVKAELLNKLSPIFFGGNMISYISRENKIFYKDPPQRFEYGTQNSASIYSFGAVMDFLKKYPRDDREKYIRSLSKYLVNRLKSLSYIDIYSQPGAIISFNINGIHPHDASEFFDKKNIILRCGNLCASPFFMNREESGVIRISLDIYNTKEEIDTLIDTIEEIREFFNEFI